MLNSPVRTKKMAQASRIAQKENFIMLLDVQLTVYSMLIAILSSSIYTQFYYLYPSSFEVYIYNVCNFPTCIYMNTCYSFLR